MNSFEFVCLVFNIQDAFGGCDLSKCVIGSRDLAFLLPLPPLPLPHPLLLPPLPFSSHLPSPLRIGDIRVCGDEVYNDRKEPSRSNEDGMEIRCMLVISMVRRF